jgi:hypothetical protein
MLSALLFIMAKIAERFILKGFQAPHLTGGN